MSSEGVSDPDETQDARGGSDDDLRRLAYGRTSTPAEERAALVAREVLAERSRAEAASASPALVPTSDKAHVDDFGTPDRHDIDVDVDVDDFDTAPATRSRLRVAVALLIVAVLALGIGIAVGHAVLAKSTTASSGHPPATPAPTATRTPIQLTMANVGATEFAREQEPGDIDQLWSFPNPQFLKPTLRLVVSWSNIGSVFVAEKAPVGTGVCLLLESPDVGGGSQGALKCVTTQKFNQKGISLKLGNVQDLRANWTTSGMTVSSLPY